MKDNDIVSWEYCHYEGNTLFQTEIVQKMGVGGVVFTGSNGTSCSVRKDNGCKFYGTSKCNATRKAAERQALNHV